MLYPAIKPSATDPPAVVLEAMSRAVCVLTTQTNSLAMLKPGLLCVIDSAELAKDLAYKIVSLVDEEARRRLTTRSMKFVRRFHDLESFIDVLTKIVCYTD